MPPLMGQTGSLRPKRRRSAEAYTLSSVSEVSGTRLLKRTKDKGHELGTSPQDKTVVGRGLLS